MNSTRTLKKSPKSTFAIPKDYAQFLEQIKQDIKQTQLRAALSVTQELIMLYWRIGKAISHKMSAEGWGAKTIDKIADDLERTFPGVAGFSARNLRYMRKFSTRYPTDNFAAAAAKLPWGHIMVILDKTPSAQEGLWYIHKSIENGWSRSVLSLWIESDLYKRQGKATNLDKCLRYWAYKC
jgi:predicted nuclease of restriction endonuclease-like (RecB) superfamily